MLKNRKSKGFTLIEIAVGLVIIGLVLGGVITLYSKQTNLNKIKETQDRLAMAEEAIIGYLLTNGRLPCPDTDGDGIQDTDLPLPAVGNTCEDTAANPIYQGVLPYVTLGLPEGDAWGADIRYVVSGSNGGDNFNDDPGAARASFDYTSVGDIVIDDYDGNTVANDVPVLFMSHGKFGGVVWADPCNAANVPDPRERENCDGDATFVSDAYRGTATAPVFNDMVRWISLPVLKARMTQANLLP